MRNFELVDTLARTLSRQMETKARVREANEKKAQKRVLESEKARHPTLERKLSSNALSGLKKRKEKGIEWGD